jgi:hypothetical protein
MGEYARESKIALSTKPGWLNEEYELLLRHKVEIKHE